MKKGEMKLQLISLYCYRIQKKCEDVYINKKPWERNN